MQTDRDVASRSHPRMAIAIPAFGRAQAMALGIAAMAKEARAEGLIIAFYVSDDTPDTSVEEALRPLIDAGSPISYRRNSPSLGHDRNLIATLQWPDADYVWLLGNRLRAAPGVLGQIMRFIGSQDLVFLNAHAGERREVDGVRGKEACALMRDVLWHQTLTGATIYGRSVREWVTSRGNDLVVVRNFPQICVMMGFASTNDAVIGWFGKRSVEGVEEDGVSYWRDRAIDVFARDWAAAVAAFPRVVPNRERARVIREHSARTDLFNTYRLITLRQSGQFRWSSLLDSGVRQSMHLSWWKLFAILALPVPVLRSGGMALALAKRRLRAG